MPEPRYRRLVRDLTAAGYESPYLERLRARVHPGQALESLEQEIAREIASALGRAGEKVDYALLRLELAAREIDTAPNAAHRRAYVERFNQIRREALAARHELRIHREAVGIRSNQLLEQIYPIPPARH